MTFLTVQKESLRLKRAQTSLIYLIKTTKEVKDFSFSWVQKREELF